MRRLISLLGIFISFSSFIIPQQYLFDPVVIQQRSEVIESQMKRDRYCMYALNTFGVARELYRWLPLVKNILGLQNIIPSVEEKQTIKEAFKSSLAYLFYTQEGWNDMIGSFSSLMGMVVITRLSDQFSHPNTLRWYTNNRALILQTLNLMNKEAIKFHNATLLPEQREGLLNRLNILYDQLIEQEKLFFGYIVYKNRYFEPENKKMAIRLMQDIERKHSAWLKDIKSALNPSDQAYTNLGSLIKAYKEDIQSDIYHFALLEGESIDSFHSVSKKSKKI